MNELREMNEGCKKRKMGEFCEGGCPFSLHFALWFLTPFANQQPFLIFLRVCVYMYMYTLHTHLWMKFIISISITIIIATTITITNPSQLRLLSSGLCSSQLLVLAVTIEIGSLSSSGALGVIRPVPWRGNPDGTHSFERESATVVCSHGGVCPTLPRSSTDLSHLLSHWDVWSPGPLALAMGLWQINLNIITVKILLTFFYQKKLSFLLNLLLLTKRPTGSRVLGIGGGALTDVFIVV